MPGEGTYMGTTKLREGSLTALALVTMYDCQVCPGDDDPEHWTECCGPSWDLSCCPASAADLFSAIEDEDGDFRDIEDR